MKVFRDAGLALLVLSVWQTAMARCPSDCSGKGSCGADNKCTCWTGFQGAADCSLRSCDTGVAWTFKPSSTTTAHTALVECSNAGVCDRQKGVCNCFSGFTGDACQRVRCPNDCSGRGRCISVKELSLTDGLDSDQNGVGPAYTNWESEINHVCKCDIGFTGYDCSQGVCDYGDDLTTVPGSGAVLATPILSTGAVTSIAVTTAGDAYNNPVITITGDGTGATATAVLTSAGALTSVTITAGGAGYTTAAATITDEYQRDYIFTVTTGASSALGGTFGFRFMGETTTFNADASTVSASNLETILEAHGGFDDVTVTRGTPDAQNGAVYTVTVGSFSSAIFNNLYQHAGNPSTSTDMTCIISSATGTSPTCALAATTNTYLKEFRPCGGRGTCAKETGTCTCFTGFGGENCGVNTNAVITNDDIPSFLITNKGYAFVGSMLKLNSLKAAATDFKFVEMIANDVAMVDVRGDGQVKIHTGGLKVVAGGAEITAGGLIVTDGAGTIATTSQTATALTATASYSSGYTGTVIVGVASETAANTFSMLDLQASGSTSVFTVLGNGETLAKAVTDATSSTSSASLKTSGGMGVAKQLYVGGILVSEVTTEATSSTVAAVMHAGGVAVAKSLYTGVKVVSEGTTDATSTTTGSIISAGGLGIAKQLYVGGVLVGTDATDATSSTAGAAMLTGGLAVAKKLYVGDQTVVESGGILVQAGGATVTAGGLLVTAGGAQVTAGGLQVVAGGAVIADGLTVSNAGGLVQTTTATETTLEVVAKSASYTGTVFSANAVRGANAAFKLISAKSNELHIASRTMTSSGTYSGTADATFNIAADSATTFQWDKDGGASTTGVAMATTATLLTEGVSVTFSHTSGYQTGAAWTVAVVESTDTVNGAIPTTTSALFEVDGTGAVALGKAASTITHTGATSMQVVSTAGVVQIEDVVFTGPAISAASTISASSTISTTGAAAIDLSNIAATLTHSAGAGSLTIESTNGFVAIETVQFAGADISKVSSVDLNVVSSAITHSAGSGTLAIVSTNGIVKIETVEFAGG